MIWDIIPDIHGHYLQLVEVLNRLGYQNRNGAWRHSNPARSVVFLGDYIDRGPQNGAVIDVVRRMVDAGSAKAILGNHEFNAIHYHSKHPETGAALRPHNDKNTLQHAAFLAEYPVGSHRTADIIQWMQGLPLYLDFGEFRVVHAAWIEPSLQEFDHLSTNGCIAPDDFYLAAQAGHPLHICAEMLCKGPEAQLPKGVKFADKSGFPRGSVRLKWWLGNAKNWKDIAISVPDPAELPDTPIPDRISTSQYAPDAAPVFFGHYWLTGTPELQTHNALCLDYSVAKGGPLTTYRFESGDKSINLNRILQTVRF